MNDGNQQSLLLFSHCEVLDEKGGICYKPQDLVHPGVADVKQSLMETVYTI